MFARFRHFGDPTINLGDVPQSQLCRIAPVGAGGAVVGAVVSWLTGRGFGRWLFAAASLLAVSGVTRLIEFWITNGTGGVT